MHQPLDHQYTVIAGCMYSDCVTVFVSFHERVCIKDVRPASGSSCGIEFQVGGIACSSLKNFVVCCQRTWLKILLL